MTDEFGTPLGGHLHHEQPRDPEATPTRAAWTTPATATVGQLMTASFWNAQVRDNENYLKQWSQHVEQGTAQMTMSAAFALQSLAFTFASAYGVAPAAPLCNVQFPGQAANAQPQAGFPSAISTTGVTFTFNNATGAAAVAQVWYIATGATS